MIIIHIIFSYLLFFLAITLCFYIPGLYILAVVKNSLSKTEKQFFSWPLGYSLFIFASYISAWIRLPYMSFIIVIVLLAYILVKKRELLTISFSLKTRVLIGIILLGSLSFTSMSFLSGLKTAQGLQFIGSVNGTDAVMHTARIKTQLYAFPPVYTGFAGYAVRGYHYFYDFLLSRFSLFFGFSAEDLYYRLFPFFLSLLYGASIYFFSTLFTKKTTEQIWILFFAYFAQSFGFLLSIFTKTVDIANGLGLVQPLELILDPSSIFAISMLIAGGYLLLQKKFTLFYAILVGVILGLIAQLKIYAGIVSLGSVGCFIAYLFLQKKNIRLYVLSFFIAVLLSAVTYLPNNFGVGKLLFSPFFLYDSFIKQNQLFSPWNWDIRMSIYRMHHNIPHVLFLYIIAAALFWILTLGTRVAVFVKFPMLFSRKFWTTPIFVFLTIMIIIPLFIASFFVQSISIFDTVQFLWIVGILFAIPAGIFYGKLYTRLPLCGKILLTILIVILSAGAYLSDENKYVFHSDPFIVYPADIKTATLIHALVPQQSFLVVVPSYIIDKHGKKIFSYYSAPLVASLTGRQTYYEYEIPVFPNTAAVNYRKSQIEKITLLLQQCNGAQVASIMHSIGSPYLLAMFDASCPTMTELKQLTTGNNWTFWKVL